MPDNKILICANTTDYDELPQLGLPDGIRTLGNEWCIEALNRKLILEIRLTPIRPSRVQYSQSLYFLEVRGLEPNALNTCC